jgi:hypothetical protein
MEPTAMPTESWRKLNRRLAGRRLPMLGRLPEFPDSLLVAGCQRSGTTVLAEILRTTDGTKSFCWSKDTERDCAFVLSGLVAHLPLGRYVFQTTYVNDPLEYRSAIDNRVVWLVRRPDSVVLSMLYNWPRWALNHLYLTTALRGPSSVGGRLRRLFPWTVRPLDRACAAYNSKTSQVHRLRQILGNRLLVVDYEDLVLEVDATLRRICEFAAMPYRAGFGSRLHAASLDKRSLLAPGAAERVRRRCWPVFEQARALARPERGGTAVREAPSGGLNPSVGSR